ncbi:LPS-assembly lipoprotein LptE [Agrilutibacter solisilvae]|uniref:LPS-assembly lipoprotein LptE n=1 Tax=Agrilutibacter solisilvae TaxID=2763317 RepID=A0A974XWL8_9GAMM|nr:LPS assembly lipoprotein LptE [Lysobacter solisilvae]QSX77219.1 hypothetical protein I8J32_010450 [Lysobacter solisilvae]
MIRQALIVSLALALTACGFHLRNDLTLPPDLGPVQVKSVDRYSPLADSLRSSIQRAGVATGTGGQNTVVLDLLSERWGDTPISVDQFGRSQEYSLRHAVIFELRLADGTDLMPRQTIELSRDYISNPVNTIGTEGEREMLVRELRREMSASILRRIGAVARTTGLTAPSGSLLDEPVAEDAAKAALEAADANPPPEDTAPTEPAPAQPAPTEPAPIEPAPDVPPKTP